MDDKLASGTVDVEIHLPAGDAVEEFREVFSKTWPAQPLRALSAADIDQIILAGTAVGALLLTTLREVACRRRHRGVTIYTGGSEPTVIKLTDPSADYVADTRLDILSDPPGGMLMVVKPNGDVERHDLCKGSFDLHSFVELLNK